MSTLYFIDVDGTVANNSHREHLSRSGAWDEFFSDRQIALDTPIEAALAHFHEGEFVHGDHVILTARPEFTKNATREWLEEFGFITPDTRIICKPDCIQTMRSGIFKKSVLDTMSKYDYAHYSQYIMVDDYDQVLTSCSELGHPFWVAEAPTCWIDGTF